MAPSSRQPAPSLWVERPDVHDAQVARVALLAAFDGEYSYAVPPAMEAVIAPGKRVMVPFGRGKQLQPAFCTAVAREPWTSTLKLCGEVLDEERLLSDHLLELGRWISRYYFTPLGRTLAAMVPEAIRRQSGFVTRRIVRLANIDAGSDDPGESTEPDAPTSRPKPKRSPSAKRDRVSDLLKSSQEGIELGALVEQAGVSRAVIIAMVKAGILAIDEQKVPAAAPDFDTPGDEPSFELGPEQQAAISRIDEVALAGAFRAILLHGVSGSGKTEVYIHSIRAIVARGRQAILLVPEIALTTQLVHRLASRFRDVAVIHSGLTGVQRSLTWAAIARGEKQVVIGTRSAVFAPCPNLGILVVDEEQEGSYKNQQSPRFHTRDVAIKRAQMLGIPVVLGSATPSLETWYNCERNRNFERLALPSRVAGLELPRVEFVDLEEDKRERYGIHLISQPMEKAIEETLAGNRQAILLLNRRGYASFLMCSRCKTPVVCPHCRTNMVFHQTTGQAICHHCSARMVVPTRCGDMTCGGTLIRFGMGTQRVEEELRTKFPAARVARADSDSLTKTSHYEQVVRDFQDRKVDVLVGTQMIAKGLDFPHVSFVGVINADSTMNAPDFRAAERTYQLITQVAGRAGRAGLGGRVIVQTLGPPPTVLRLAAQHAYAPFAEHELPIRKRVGWPPYSRIARVIISHKTPQEASDTARGFVERLREQGFTHGLKMQVVGPQSAPLARLRNQYRYDFLIRTPNANQLLKVLEHLRHHDLLTPNTPHALVDVDPVSLL